jgi:spermidine/putrescine transport system permease protein
LNRTLARLFASTPIYLWLLLLVIAPNALLVVTSFFKSSGGVTIYEFTLSNYERAAGSATLRLLIAKTTLTALAAAFLATCIAYPMAFLVSRRLGRYKYIIVLAVIVPLWVSVMIRAFAWRIILGESGVLNTFLVSTGILSEPSDAFLFTRSSVLLALTYMAIPYVFVTAFTALERVPNSLVESAYDNGATPWNTMRYVIWPLSRSGAAIGFSLAFLIAVGDYLTPTMVGGLNGTMVGMVIASQFGLAGNWPYGAAMAICLMVSVAVILVIVALLTRTKGVIDAVDSGATISHHPARTPLGRFAQSAGVWVGIGLPLAFLYLPLMIIAVFSFNASTVQALPLSGFTLQWYAELWANDGLKDAFFRTIQVGVLTVIVSILVAVPFAMIFHYMRLWGAPILQGLIALPVAVPGVVLGHCMFVMPIVLLIVLGRFNRLDPTLGQAAMDLGANRLQTFRYVIFPLIKSAIFGAALLGFTLSMDEVIVTLFLAGSEPTLPVYVWNQMRFGFTPSVNAVFTLIGLVSLTVVLAGVWVLGRGQKSDGGTPEWLIR